jgi:5'-deoxynucleotidase
MSSIEYFNIGDIFRSADISRWHSVKTLKNQNNAEHQFLVTWIADILSHRIYPKISERQQLDLLRYNLGHDIPEALTGDIASPTKRALEKYFKDGENPLDDLESKLCPGYKILKDKVEGNPLRRISKLADLIEMIVFINQEGVGTYSETIEANLYRGVDEMIASSYEKYPDLKWDEARKIIDEIFKAHGSHLEFDWNASSLS